MIVTAKNINPYADFGVSISKSTISVGDKITVFYEGLLVKSGADVIFTHYGYGNTWDNKDFIQMDKEEGRFKVTLTATSAGSLNISFKDGADNWDNNSSENYSYKVTKKEKEDVTAKEPAKAKKVAEKPAVKTIEKTTEKEVVPKKTATKTKTVSDKKKA